MNTTEKIVEAYFRLCKNCFTYPDMKVINGNNRQLDLLAYNLMDNSQYHIEVSVTHQENWCPTPEQLVDMFDKKFFGFPPQRSGKNTDSEKGKKYYQNIVKTYESVGFDLDKIKRVWVCWAVKGVEGLDQKITEYCNRQSIQKNKIEVLQFRDVIIRELLKKIGTSNYEDDSLRTLSLIEQYNKQFNKK